MINRRNFLGQASMFAVASALPFEWLYAQDAASGTDVPLSPHFPLGIASADAQSNKAIFWAYYDGFRPLKLCVWSVEDGAIWLDVQKADGGFVQVEVNSLSAYKKYYYSFYETDFLGKVIRRSEIGSLKTAPDSSQLVPLKFGAVSCVKYKYEPFVLEQAAARNDLDFFIMNGDNSYNDGAFKLEEFRMRWARTMSKKGYKDLRRSTSIIGAIDDHEIEDNFNPERIERAKFSNGMQAFYEHMPMRRDTDYPDRMWRKLSWGRTLDVFVLDCRTERKSTEREYISPEQMAWLKEELSNSKAMFKVIVNSVPISEFSLLPMAYDRWEGYPEQRTEILEHIDNNHIQNLLWVSGDFHFSSYGRLSRHGPGSTQMEVLAGPGAQRPNIAGYPLKLSSQFDWVHVANNYITVDCDILSQKMKVEPHFDLTHRADSFKGEGLSSVEFESEF